MAGVLLVSDEPSTAGFVRSALEQAGYTVTLAPSVADADHWLRADSIDIVVADLHIPEC
jgi:DNA-binding response OmpR family regulator